MDRSNRFKRKTQRQKLGPRDLLEKVDEMGGQTGFALELDPTANSNMQELSAGIYGQRTVENASSFQRTRRFETPRRVSSKASHPTAAVNSASRSAAQSKGSFGRSIFSRASSNKTKNELVSAVHIICAVSENLARETCVASLDAGSPTSMQVTKQGNGQTYVETISYLEVLKPDEVLLNEGRQNSQLARKILELYNVTADGSGAAELPNRRQRRRTSMGGDQEDEEEFESDKGGRFGSLGGSTVVKFVSRSCFDQTKGAELLQKIAREETYDSSVVEEYILLSSAHAVLIYMQISLGASFAKHSLYLSINSGGKSRMNIDRFTMLQLELLVNSKTGKAKDSLIGTIDCTKTTVGSRLLRTNLMSPPTRVDTINARLELVTLFMGSEDFFFSTLGHLKSLPDVDKMLSNIALVPQKNGRKGTGSEVNERIASKGITALVCIKTTLQALPSFVGVLRDHLHTIDSENDESFDDSTIATDRSSLLVGLGSGRIGPLNSHHLLRAIVSVMSQASLGIVLAAVSDVFTETTTFSRNAHKMRHQECFALKCEEDGMMGVIRKAFLRNVDDIYKLADDYAELHGFAVIVKYSGSRGYFLNVPVDVGTELPPLFLHPAKSGRFLICTTEEVSSLNARAKDNVHDLLLMTHDRVQEVIGFARLHYDAVANLCDAIALLDMCHSFTDNVALSQIKWCRPVVSDRSMHRYDDADDASASSDQGAAMVIRNGRYPINATGSTGLVSVGGPQAHIPNDTYASDERFFTVITGINGSGKSTYLKQVAIITVLAHCGSYVPAEQATIPIRDRLCCRIGNADDQEHNISTFMQEMKETAFICNNATSRSLVLVDELGRATSNEDGVGIAWSVSEYLLKKHAMTFFVTHYPQLSCLAKVYPSVQNVHMEAAVTRGVQGEIKYTHKVRPGPCSIDTGYGVELAAACAWPDDVVDDARAMQVSCEALLPDESLCNERSMDQISETRTKAYQALGLMGAELKDLVADEKAQTYATIRATLTRLQQRHAPSVDKELIACMDQLLFRGARRPRQQNLTEAQPFEADAEVRDNAAKIAKAADSDSSDGTSDLSSSSSSSDSSDDESSTPSEHVRA